MSYQLEHALRWADERFPVAVKPLSGTGSEGVAISADEITLQSGYERHPAGAPFLMEQYPTGPELSVEAISDRGEIAFHGLTEKTTTRPPFCAKNARRFPGDRAAADRFPADRFPADRFPADRFSADRDAVRDLLERVVRALGIGSGIVQLELWIAPDGPHIMEVAVHTPGGNIMDIVQAASGFDFYDAAIAIAAGEPAPRPPLAGDTACVWPSTPPLDVVTSIDDTDRVAGPPGVVDMEVDVEVGGTVPPRRSSLARVSMVIAHSEDRDTLGHRLRTVQDELRITVRPAGEPIEQQDGKPAGKPPPVEQADGEAGSREAADEEPGSREPGSGEAASEEPDSGELGSEAAGGAVGRGGGKRVSA